MRPAIIPLFALYDILGLGKIAFWGFDLPEQQVELKAEG
jgi:hypothetical protein